ncbi:hypothetical protein [Synechococcus sp. PCC 7336]|uniref:hypothetical protein n=1 Tax=Synechococcus sp. PCC 7336 TaxID=195250 RepID=UPI0012EB02EF|nr:hypothetical protein [Synechococcus sp. PCC 7336]
MNGIDQAAAGFGNGLTFGGTSLVREALFGEAAIRNQEGLIFETTNFAGELVRDATIAALSGGTGTAASVATSIDDVQTGVDVFNAGRTLTDGELNASDALAVITALTSGSGGRNLDEAGDALSRTNRNLDTPGSSNVGNPGSSSIDTNSGNVFERGDNTARLRNNDGFASDNIALNLRPDEPTSVPLFRAVQDAELEDIRDSQAFRNVPAMGQGKFFSTTEEGAASFARQDFNASLRNEPSPSPFTIVETSIPEPLINADMISSVDRGIPTVVVPQNILPFLDTPVELPSITLRNP